MHAEHILSRIYNCTKPGIRPNDNAATTHFIRHISILQLHVKICPVCMYGIVCMELCMHVCVHISATYTS